MLRQEITISPFRFLVKQCQSSKAHVFQNPIRFIYYGVNSPGWLVLWELQLNIKPSPRKREKENNKKEEKNRSKIEETKKALQKKQTRKHSTHAASIPGLALLLISRYSYSIRIMKTQMRRWNGHCEDPAQTGYQGAVWFWFPLFV